MSHSEEFLAFQFWRYLCHVRLNNRNKEKAEALLSEFADEDDEAAIYTTWSSFSICQHVLTAISFKLEIYYLNRDLWRMYLLSMAHRRSKLQRRQIIKKKLVPYRPDSPKDLGR
ncbi:unnamed protein product [Thlaspi arvense]|uniref:Uncharacterized protein n=1 Tax=Thlaspi arvense TaxID=13288 RepID=A0AAU9RC26_THLAR|nr:unnamed protein product [Thlaspi arvense]